MLKRCLALMGLLVLAGCGSAKPVVHLSAAKPVQSAMGSVHPSGWGSVHAPAPKGFRLTPTREQFDTVTLSTVPAGAQFLAGYTDGHWPTFGPMVRSFPSAKVKSIAVFFGDVAQCGDFEPGDMGPELAVQWFHFEQNHLVLKPCIYSSWWEFTNQIIPNLNRAGIPRSAYWAWDADYVYYPRLDAGFDATQWTNKAHGLNLDESTATLAFLGVSPPKPHPVCFGAHPQNTAFCRKVQTQVKNWQSAASSSKAASQGTQRAIDRLVVRKGMFDQRFRYFDGKALATIKAFS